MKHLAAYSVLALIGFLLGPIAGAAEPITIQSITAAGSACPEGTVSITIAPDNRSFSVLFDQALVQSSQDNPIENKLCELTIQSRVSAGWKFNLYSNDFRGFSQVDKSSVTFQRTSYYRLNLKNKWQLLKQSKKQFTTPFNDNYLINHKLKLEQPKVVRNEDHVETIKVQLQLVSRSSKQKQTSAQLALDSFDGMVEGSKDLCSHQ